MASIILNYGSHLMEFVMYAFVGIVDVGAIAIVVYHWMSRLIWVGDCPVEGAAYHCYIGGDTSRGATHTYIHTYIPSLA